MIELKSLKTVRQKLIAILMATSAVAVILSCIIFMAGSLRLDYLGEVHMTSSLANVVGQNCQAALDFENPEDAVMMLSSLHAEPTIVAAWIYDANDNIFAVYHRNEKSEIPPCGFEQEGHQYTKGCLEVSKNIYGMEGETIGTIWIKDDMNNIRAALKNNLMVLAIVIVVALASAYFIASGLQRIISQPILSLANTSALVAEKNDYSIRAEKYSEDEIGQLIDSFNNMLDKIANSVHEKELLMRTLEQKNKELQSIVYISSHDLRSPLVNILGFSGELGESCKDLKESLKDQLLNEDAQKKIEALLTESIPESLKFITSGTLKMKTLLDGLLQVSRIGALALNIKKLDMNTMLKKITDAMQFQIKQADIDISIESLPACYGDANQIDQVFTNIIDNAIKYLSTDRKGKVRISGYTEDNESIYCIEDNGIGIAAQHQRNIFELFHRLEPTGPVQGEGLGLTIVSRMLDRNHGKICLESVLDQGSKFIISLPAADK